MLTNAVTPVLYAAYFFTSFVTVHYFLILLQETSWGTKEYFHRLSRENMRWLPVVFAVIPTSALILDYRLLGIVLMIVFEAAACLYYAPWPSRPGLDRTDRSRHILAIWLILWAALVLVTLFIPGHPLNAVLAICCISFLTIPFLVPVLYRLEQPIEQKAGGRYVHVSRRLMSFHQGLRIIAVAGSDDSPVCGQALNIILSSEYDCELAKNVVRTSLDAARAIREIENPAAEILICRIDAADGGEMKAIVQTLHPEIVIQTAADFWSVSEGLAPVGENGLCFINGDDEVLRKIVRTDHVLTYGLDERDDCHGRILETGWMGTIFGVSASKEWDREYRFRTTLLGRKDITSLVGAVSIAYTLGISEEQAAKQVARLTGTEHHLQLMQRGPVPGVEELVWIDDSANDDPESAEEALDALNRFKGVKILVTDGFARIGAIQETANKNFGSRAAGVCDRIILVGKEPVFGLRQGILDAGFMPEHLLEAEDENAAMQLIRDYQKETGALEPLQGAVLMEYAAPDAET